MGRWSSETTATISAADGPPASRARASRTPTGSFAVRRPAGVGRPSSSTRPSARRVSSAARISAAGGGVSSGRPSPRGVPQQASQSAASVRSAAVISGGDWAGIPASSASENTRTARPGP